MASPGFHADIEQTRFSLPLPVTGLQERKRKKKNNKLPHHSVCSNTLVPPFYPDSRTIHILTLCELTLATDRLFFSPFNKYQCIGCPGAVPKQHAPYDTHHHSFIHFFDRFFCVILSLSPSFAAFLLLRTRILPAPFSFCLLKFFCDFFFFCVFFFPQPLSRPFSPRFPEAQGTVQNGMLWLDTHSSPPPTRGRATKRLVTIQREQIHTCHDLLRGASSCAGPGDLTWRNTWKIKDKMGHS